MKKDKLTIGLVLDDGLDKPDGVQQYVLGLGDWMAKQGHEVHYLVGESKRQDIDNLHPMAKNIKVSFNGNKLTIPLLSSGRKISKLLGSYGFDVLHVQVPYSPLMGGRIVNRAWDTTAVVGTFHVLPYGLVSSVGSGLLGMFTRWQNKRFDRFFSVSEPARIFARDKYKITSAVIPNFVDTSKYKKSSKSQGNTLRLIFVNRLVERKGCRHLIEAVKYARDNKLFKKHVAIDICGKGPQFNELKKFCRDNDLKNIKLRGFVSEEDKIKLLSEADVAVYPSLGGESFGIVLLEAMASGCAVIAGDNPGYRSVLQDSEDSLIEPKDTAGFARHLAKIVNDDNFRKDLLSRQQSLVTSFDINTVGRQLQQQYYQAKHDKLGETNA